ncbi:MAG: TonB-dependent siderophore receptor [Bacteroidota bacterium]
MKYLYLFIICWVAIPTCAQQPKGSLKGSLKGSVRTFDNQPAPNVNVMLKGTDKGTTTDDNGTFELRNYPAGKYILKASAINFESKEIAVEVIAGETTSIAPIVLDETSQHLEAVVVTGSKDNQYVETKASESLRIGSDLIEVPQNIKVTTRQTLQDLGVLNKSEIARTVSGIVKSYGEDLDMTFQIRGMNSTYNTYRNGVGGPIWWNAQEDAAMIEKVEFVKGPAGFMLANSEPGGLLNTVTKQPTHQQIAEVNVGMGSYNLMRTTVDLGGEFVKDGKLTYRLNAGVQRNSQYYKFGNMTRYFVCPVIKYEFDEKTSITFEHNFVQATTQENTHNLFTIDQKFFAIPSSTAINDPNIGQFMGRDIYNRVSASHQFDKNWRLNFNAAYMSTDWDGYTMYLDGISPTKDSLYRYSYYTDWTGKLFNTQLFLNGEFKTGAASHNVLIGLDFGDAREGSVYGDNYGQHKYTLALANPTYYLPKDSLRNFSHDMSWISTNKWQALYLQDHLKLYDRLIFTIAGRLTYLTTGQDYNSPPDDPDYEINDHAFTPRLGVTYMISPTMSAYGLYDQSFLAQRGAIYGGTRLPPLRGSNREVGVKGMFLDKKLQVSAAMYDITKNNVGTSDPEHQGFYLKTGQVRSTGFEFDITGNITPDLVIIANYSKINARITRDNDSTLVGIKNQGTPDQVANAWMKYKIPVGVLKGLGIGFGVQYVGLRSGISPGWNNQDGNKFLPAYTIFDASISYATEKFTVGLNVYNLANKKYVSNGYWYPDFQEWYYSPGLPTNFRLQTSIRL